MPQKNNRMDYPDLGFTRQAALTSAADIAWPKGFAHVDKLTTVGSGQATFDALAEGIMTWHIQRRAGLTVQAPPRAVLGARVVSGFGVGQLRLPVPCEVVWSMETQKVTGPDGVEVTRARWFSREELQAAVLAGEITISSRLSIARSLIEHWYGGRIQDLTGS